MNFSKIHIIDQHKCSSIFGLQKPGWALGEPVCHVCSLNHFLYADITKIHKAIFPFGSDAAIQLSAFNQFFVSGCSAVTLLN